MGWTQQTHRKGFTGYHRPQLRCNGWDVFHASDLTSLFLCSYETWWYHPGETRRNDAQKNYLSFPRDTEGRTRWLCCWNRPRASEALDFCKGGASIQQHPSDWKHGQCSGSSYDSCGQGQHHLNKSLRDIADFYQALAQRQNVFRKANVPRVDLLSSARITTLWNLIKRDYAVIMVNDDLRIGQGI